MRVDGQGLGASGPVTGAAGTRMVTPEAVTVELETAGVGSRLLAALLDLLLICVGMILLAFGFGLGGSVLERAGVPEWVLVTLMALLFTAWLLGYQIVQEAAFRGRTIGKRALGLRVVTREGGPIRFRHALVRGLFCLVDWWFMFGVVAITAILFSRHNQRLGDMVAGTLVLRERTGAASPRAVTFAPPPGLEHYATMLDASAVGTDEYQAVRSFLLRRTSLNEQARVSLGVQLANQIAARVNPQPPPGTHPEAFLVAVAAAYQRRQRGPAQLPGAVPYQSWGAAWGVHHPGQGTHPRPGGSPAGGARPGEEPGGTRAAPDWTSEDGFVPPS